MKRTSKQSAVYIVWVWKKRKSILQIKVLPVAWFARASGYILAKYTRGACVRVKTRYFEKFKINISTLCRIQTKLST